MNDSSHRLAVVMPGALMFQSAPPPGIPDIDSMRSRQVFMLKASPALANLDPQERAPLIESLTKTLRRAEYHYLRFLELRRALDERRRALPGFIVSDGIVECLHFELQALCGAARMALDEIVYLIGRRHGVATRRARKKPWETSDIVTKPLPPECNVPEVRLLRTRADWFAMLNAYRNSAFHHGWRHGGGHFAPDDTRRAARSPAMNALLLPDQGSLGRRSKPHEWTWADGTTVDGVVDGVHRGLGEFVEELCRDCWATPEPLPGTAPKEDMPTLAVFLPRPCVLTAPRALIIPFYSSREAAEQAEPLRRDPQLELVEVQASNVMMGQPSLTFSLAGLERNQLPAGTSAIQILLDPIPSDPTWTNIRCTTHVQLDLASFFDAGTHQPISMPAGDLERVYVWTETVAHDWLDDIDTAQLARGIAQGGSE